ncbi:PfkB family carbohydrate kinase [Streptomyces sp. NPDC007808]|uniref:PfkB family carbohydrate kinase n=1 Tax=Streptomyces sp. NPDC007808 TaxID=3364779 RepID=UPI0036A89BD7
MVAFLPSRPGRLADVPSFERGIGGAESNVVCGLAAAGHTARWVGRVGADGFGDHLVRRIASYGVDTEAVQVDPVRPTGVYFRTAGDRGTDAHEVAYYRAGSAASAMSAGNVDLGAVRAGRVLHLSGITAALSDSCLELLCELTAPGADRPLVSFDVNHRAGLWRRADGAQTLLWLARRCDLVFVGTDEAESAWGVTDGPVAIRALLPEPAVLVVKDGARGATAFERSREAGGRTAPAAGSRAAVPAPVPRVDGAVHAPGRAPHARPAAMLGASSGRHVDAGCVPGASSERPGHAGGVPDAPRIHPVDAACAPRPDAAPPAFVPALSVDVVAAVGAGDAFAAGFLSATLRELPLRARLRHGHLWAAAALTAPGDLAVPPGRGHADHLAALDDAAWEKLRLGPGWTQITEGTDEEVRTP